MKKYLLIFSLLVTMAIAFSVNRVFAQSPVIPANFQIDTRIDNMGYWRQCAAWGLVPVQPYHKVPAAVYTGSKTLRRGVLVVDSPDVPTTNEPSNSTQSENSIVVNPNNEAMLLNSNNSTPQPSNGSVKGADWLHSADAGETWGGSVEGPGGSNSGDPAAVIDLNGRWFIGYIDNASGQSVSYSDDNGANWTVKKVANGSFVNLLDKNHLWVDISPTSPYKGYLYNGWMSSNNIFVSMSSSSGSSWTSPVNISSATAAGSHNQGINFKCGPDGQVYAAWAVYDNWPGDEKAIGFAKSLNGGSTWQPAIRALNNIRGIRTTGVSQNMRVNSFPVMTVDISNSPYRGHIYIVWTNIGVPGINTGSGSSVYMIKSTDEGQTWSAPKRIHSDSTTGKHHYLPWIVCDQATGYLAVVFYDNRNCAANQAEAWMAWSTNGGETFEDIKVSDVTFTPSPIPMMAQNYMGDYLAIDAYAGKAFPCWTDTRSGHCLTYVSPIDILIPQSSIENTEHILNDTTFGNHNGLMDYGETELMGLRMKNVGEAIADSVKVYLTCDNPYISIQDSTDDYGHFEIGQEKYIHNGYKFKVNDSIANNTLVTFTVKAVNALDSATYSTFQMTAHAPDVSILSMSISDPAPGGNNNGRLDPGESAILQIETKNQGIWDAENVVSQLTSLNGYMTIGTGTVQIGTLHAGETVIASFPVTVNSAAPVGSAARVHNVATSKYRVHDKFFNAKIGLIVEDWETGNFTKFPWQFTDPSKPWTIDPVIRYEKLYGARSGVITHGETTGIFLQYNVAMDDSISFFRRISSQPIKDNLKFYIDDAMVGMWSNFSDTSFRRFAFPVLAGSHTFKWIYEKDNSGSSGLDACWTDFIVFPPQYITSANAGGDASVCAGETYQLNGMAYSYDSVAWTTAGTGVFSNTAILNPVYTPGNLDIQNGSVVLTLVAYGMNGADTTSAMTLTIEPAPTANAGNDGAICSGTAFNLSDAAATNYNAVLWTTSGDGQFADNSILNTSYLPGPADRQSGMATLTLAAIGSASCEPASDLLLLTIKPAPQVNLGKDTILCAGQSIILNATTPDAQSYLWHPSGATSASLTIDSTGIGLHTQTISVLVTGSNACSGSDTVNVSFKVCGGMDDMEGVAFQVYPNPTNGKFTIEIKSAYQQTMDVTLLNAAGESVQKESHSILSGTNRITMDVTGIPAGNYLLRLSNDRGSLQRKLIITR